MACVDVLFGASQEQVGLSQRYANCTGWILDLRVSIADYSSRHVDLIVVVARAVRYLATQMVQGQSWHIALVTYQHIVTRVDVAAVEPNIRVAVVLRGCNNKKGYSLSELILTYLGCVSGVRLVGQPVS